MRLNHKNLKRSRNRIISLIGILIIIILPIIFNEILFPTFNGNVNNINNAIPDKDNVEEEQKVVPNSSAEILSWWNDTWNYRVKIEVKAQEKTIKNVPIEKRLNFTKLLYELNIHDRFDWNSTRVVEFDQATQKWIEIPCVANEYLDSVIDYDYNNKTNAVVDILWIMNGTTNKDDIRIYFIYFDSLANGKKPERDYGYRGAYYGLGGSQHYAPPYNTENLIYRDYFRLADFSASPYRDEENHYGNADNPFDDIYGYPIVDELDDYEGKVGRVKDQIDRQAHAGRDQRHNIDFYWDTPGQEPHFEILKVAIRADDPSTHTALYVLTDDGWKVIMYTPGAKNTQGIFDGVVDRIYGCTIICDSKWRIYEYDLRHLSGTNYAWQIEFFQATDAPNTNDFWFDNMIAYQADSETLLSGNTSYFIPETQVFAPEFRKASILVHALDLYGNSIPNVIISMYNRSDLVRTNISDNNGCVSFTGIILIKYNFTVSMISELSGHTKIINVTSSSINIEFSFQEIDLICNISRNIFEVLDVDGIPLDSGWIIVGNSSHNLYNLTIDGSGKAIFRWLNITPYLYNYTVFYHNEIYNQKTIKIASGEITAVNSTVPVHVNLTTVNFTVLSYPSTDPIAGAELKLWVNNSLGKSVVNLTTDQYGKATLRWLNSSGINGNYSLKINFWGFQKFNKSNTDFPPSVKEINFTIRAKSYFDLRIPVNPDKFETKLISLNPTDEIVIKGGSNLKLRVLFNRSKTDEVSELLGPIYADSMPYQILNGSTVVQSGELTHEIGNEGRHQALINTSSLKSNLNYLIKVSAQKAGYSIPSDLFFDLYLTKNDVELNQSENDDSIQMINFSDNVNMSIKPYSKISESFIVEEGITQDSEHNFKFSVPDISNDWNLSRIVFNIYNVTHGSFDDIELNIMGPYGLPYKWDKDNATNYYFHSEDASNGTWINLVIDINKGSPTEKNTFEFLINGTFVGNVDVIAEASFIRDVVDVQYSRFNITESINILLAKYSGWAIKKITFELENCKNPDDWTLIDPWNDAKLNITTNEGFSYSVNSEGGGAGNLTIDDRIIYPLDNKFLFTIENSTNIVFDAIIKVEYIQEFYPNPYLEINSLSKIVSGFVNGTFQISAPEENQSTMLIFHEIYNGTDYLSPSELAMNITIGTETFEVLNNQFQGEWTFSLNDFDKNIIFNASIETNQLVNFSLSFLGSYLRNVVYSPIGTVSYFIIENPSVNGTVQYNKDLKCYLQSINTSLLEPSGYTVRFTFNKDQYQSAIKDLNMTVLNRLTLINGTSQLDEIQKVINAIEAVNFTFSYEDAQTREKIIGLDDQSYSWKIYDSEGYFIISGARALILNADNLYVLDFDTENRSVGRYEFNITLSKNGYEEKNAMINLIILERPTLINGKSKLDTIEEEIYLEEEIDLIFSYIDAITLKHITGLNDHSYTWEKYDKEGEKIDSGKGDLILNDDGLYSLDFDSENRESGIYEIVVSLYKHNYASKSATIDLNISKRGMTPILSDNFKDRKISVVKGTTVIIEVELKDPTKKDIALTEATVTINIGGEDYDFEEVEDGLYRYEFSTSNVDALIVSKTLKGIIYIKKSNYVSEEIEIIIVVEMEQILPGVPTFYFLIFVVVFAALAGSIVSYRTIRKATLPKFIKKIRSMKKAIKSRKRKDLD